MEALLFPAVFPCYLRLVSFPSTDGAGEQGTPGNLARAFPLSSKPSRAGTIPLDEIESVKQVKVHGLYSWNAIPGFWTSLPGISLKLASAAGMYCGPHALQITRIDGRVFNVGTPEPEVLAAVIDDARPGVTLEVTDSSGSD